jgi:hypothetical protein
VVGISNKKEIHLAGNMKKILDLVEKLETVQHMVRVHEEPGKHVWHVVFRKDKPLIIKSVIFESMHFEFDPNVSLVIRAATDGGVAGGAPAPGPGPAPASGEDSGLTDDESGGGPAKKKRRRAVTYAECVAMARARSAKDVSGARKEAP